MNTNQAPLQKCPHCEKYTNPIRHHGKGCISEGQPLPAGFPTCTYGVVLKCECGWKINRQYEKVNP